MNTGTSHFRRSIYIFIPIPARKYESLFSGAVSIGSGEFRSTEYLAKIISEFKRRYPLVRYEIYSGNAGNIRDYIERGLLDIGLMSEPIDIRKYNFVNMPVKEQWGVYVPDDSPLCEKESVAPEDLKGMSVVSATGDFNQSRIVKWLGEFKEDTSLAASSNLPYNQAVLAKEKINLFMKGQDKDLNEIYERFGVDYDLLSLLMHRDEDADGHFHIRWGEQTIA